MLSVSDDHLEAMQIFTERVQEQIEGVRAEQEQFKFDMTPFTIGDCIPDDKSNSIVGKVVVINAEVNPLRVPPFCLSACVGGRRTRCEGRQGQAVFGTSLADGKHARWEDVTCLGKSSQRKCPHGRKKPLQKSRHRKK